MTVSDAVAWWGAVVATGLAARDLYRGRRRRATLSVSASPNMEPVSEVRGARANGKYVLVEVVNTGGVETTLTHLVVRHYKTLAARLRGQPSVQAVLIQPPGFQGLPFALPPGKRWTGLMDQAELERKAGGGGYLFCGVMHSGSRKAALTRVRLSRSPF